jgi:hypothetical protein
MKNFKDKCVKMTTDSLIKFEEKNKTIIFDNKDRKNFLMVKVDGCQITEGDKCDDLLINNITGDEYFIELKGTKVGHAFEQLDCTVNQLSDKSNKEKSIKLYIVSANVAPQLGPKKQKYMKRWKKAYNASLTIKEKKLVVCL